MNRPPSDNNATSAGWSDLAAELDRWSAAGQVAEFWWRDDDAVAPSSQLDRLLRLADGVPLALAVIPALARPELARMLNGMQKVAVLQHGWQHANHAGSGKKSEYPEGRSASVVAAEIGAGIARLKGLFGPLMMPAFVPPWNRFADSFLPLLPPLGIARLSAISSVRAAPPTPPGLARCDVDLDVVAWRDGGGFIGVATALSGLLGLLRQRRTEAALAPRPIGLLTHHRVMDEATAAFLSALLSLTHNHPAVCWAAPAETVR
jgi:hypothetical protein